MVALLLTTTISCSDAFKMIKNVSNAINLNTQQKIELVQTHVKFVPSCPFKVVPDGKPKQ